MQSASIFRSQNALEQLTNGFEKVSWSCDKIDMEKKQRTE